MVKKRKKYKLINKVFKYFLQNKHLLIIPVVSVIILYLHYINSLSFSFTDAYNSYARAYFMEKGRSLYSGIFSHHNMLMVYISYVIQLLFQPQSLYKLVMTHQMFLAIFSVIMASLIIIRFRYVGLAFVLIYELCKYFLFGNLFLAEALVSYFIVYLAGLAFLKLQKEEIYNIEFILSGVFAWFVVFLREPFIPLTLLLYGIILFDKANKQAKIVSVIIFILLSVGIISTVELSEYYFHIITLNFGGYIQSELQNQDIWGVGLVKIFFYPFYIFLIGKLNDFRFILIALSSNFLLLNFILLKKRKFLIAIFLFMILGLANIRMRIPGETFYSAFHMLPWFALFTYLVPATTFYLYQNYKFNKLIIINVLVFFIITLIALMPPFTVAKQTTDRQFDYETSYARFYVNGEAILRLSNPDDLLFVEDWDTLVYWQSGLESSYKYAMYFPVMKGVDKYKMELDRMYNLNPPQFYYTDCKYKENPLPTKVASDYIRLNKDGYPSCVFIHKSKIAEISDEKWNNVKEFGFTLPESATF